MNKDYWNLPVIAVSIFDHAMFGCAHCGTRNGNIVVWTVLAVIWECESSSCGKITCQLPIGVSSSNLPFYDKNRNAFNPKLEKHPFQYGAHPRKVIGYLESISGTKPAEK